MNVKCEFYDVDYCAKISNFAAEKIIDNVWVIPK